MELFFSYGHDKHTPLVKRLRDDLKPSHKVWIDYEKLNYDNPDDLAMRTYHPDWRRSITEGIEGSEIVLSFASEHAFRDETAVCFDELKIAVFVKRAFVQTVLLESKAENRVPASAAHRQYIYLNEWADAKGKDAEKIYPSEGDPDYPDFMRWYKGKLEEIKAKLATPEVQRYHDELKKLYELLNPYVDTSSKQDELAQSVFMGRGWLSQKVQAWVNADKAKRGRALLITGSPGMGKSAFVVNEFMRSPDVGAAVFCRFDDPDANNIDDIARSIAYQMAVRYDDFRERLLAVLEEEEEIHKRGNTPKGRVFDRYVFNIANQLIDGEREYFIILIDGLDEVKVVEDENPVAEALKRELDSGRDFMRFIFTSRKNDHVLTPLERVPEIDLDAFSVEGSEDIKKYVASEIERASKGSPDVAKKIEENPELPQKIIEASEGNFLYAKYACSQIDELSMEGGLPKGLNGFYVDAMKRLRNEVDFDSACEALGVIAASDEGVPERTLRRAVGWDKGKKRREYGQFKKRLSMYIMESGDAGEGEASLSFFHKSFADWLGSDGAADYSCDREYSRELLARACFEAYEKCAEDGSFNDMNDYEAFNLIPLLKENQKEFKEEYKRVLSDSAFFDGLLDRARECQAAARVGILERVNESFPVIDLDALMGEKSWEVVELQRTRVLEVLVSSYCKLIRIEDAIRSQKEVLDAWRRLMVMQPSIEIIARYESSVHGYAGMFEGGRYGFPDDYESAKRIYLEGMDTLGGLDGNAQVTEYLEERLISLYRSLAQLARFNHNFDDATMFASKRVMLIESFIRSRGLRMDASFSTDLLYYLPYTWLSGVFDEQGETDQALGVLREGLSFLREHLVFESKDSDARQWDSDFVRFKNLMGVYNAMAGIAGKSRDACLLQAICDEQLAYIAETIGSLIISPSDKAEVVAKATETYLRNIPDGMEDERFSLIERVKPWFDTLEEEMDDLVYVQGIEPAPRERLADLYAGANAFERSIEEYSGVLDRVRAIRVEKTDTDRRMSRIVGLYGSMAAKAVKNECADEAIEYCRLALNEVKQSLVADGEGVEDLFASNAACGIVPKALLDAYDNLSYTLRDVGNFAEACEVAEESSVILEFALEKNKENRSIINGLSSTYDFLLHCYEKAGMIREAISATRRNVDLYRNEEDKHCYAGSLYSLEKLYRKASQWDEVSELSLEQLILAEEAAHDDLGRYMGKILGCMSSHAECLIRLKGEDAARAFLRERCHDAPHVFPAVLANPQFKMDAKNEMRGIQSRIKRDEFDDPEIGRKLIELISEWSGVEVPGPPKKRS